ncbi:MAG: TonB-dependent receptor [Bacteroidales bacterium]|nr:TonB-dependent receptor [Bacteroidales bacterium]
MSIIAQKPTITSLPDRIVVSVENSLLANTSDGLEMLRLTPGVLVSPLGDISVLGRGTPIIYINNHRVHSFAEVESLDPQFIKSVDVIDMPSAKYEADANSVIRITTIRRNDFYNVRVGGRLSRRRDWSGQAFADINLQKNKLSANLYYQFIDSRSHPKQHNHYYGADGYLINFDYLEDYTHSNTHNVRSGLEYAIAKNHVVGWQGNAYFSASNGSIDKLVSNETPNTYDFNVLSGSQGKGNDYVSTLYYNWNIDTKGQKLSATFDYTHADFDGCDTFRNAPVGASYLDYVLNSNRNNGINDVYIGKIDYTLPIGNNLTLNAGSRYSAILGNQETKISGSMDYANTYSTDERNLAGYAEAFLTLSEKWSLMAGLRAERMHRSNSENGKPKFDFTEIGLYPRVNLLFKPAPSYSIRVSYSKTVARPSFSALDPTLSIDSLSNNHGNPNLTNSFTHNISLSVNLPHSIGFSFYYNRIIKPIMQEIQSGSENPNILEGRWYNGNPTNSFFASTYANLNPTSWWFLYVEAAYSQRCYTFESEGITIINDKPQLTGMVVNTFSLPKQWRISLNFQVSSTHSSGTVVNKDSYMIYAQVNKKLLNNALDITLSFNDILGTNAAKQQSLLRGERYTYFYSDIRGVTLSASYKFGKSKKFFRSRTVGDEERGRLERQN